MAGDGGLGLFKSEQPPCKWSHASDGMEGLNWRSPLKQWLHYNLRYGSS